jgi:predicted kinase
MAGTPVTAAELADAPEPELAALARCPQTVAHHGEGHVAAHSVMALEALAEAGDDGPLSRLAVLLHDIGKPASTVAVSAEKFRSAGHDEAGAELVSTLFLTDRHLVGLPAGAYPAVHAAVRQHMWVWQADEIPAAAWLRSSHLLDPALLAAVWSADARGRICDDRAELLERVEYARLVQAEAGGGERDSWGLLAAAADPDSLAPGPRREVFRAVTGGDITSAGHATAALAAAARAARPALTYTIGLPGLGKSTWARARWQPATGGRVLSATGARRRDRRAATAAVRAALPGLLGAGTPVCVDATHLTRPSRDHLLAAAGRYHADVHAVLFRAPLALALARQTARPQQDDVPADAVRAMAAGMRWPTPDEYATLTVVEPDGRWWRYGPQTRDLPVDAAVRLAGGSAAQPGPWSGGQP